MLCIMAYIQLNMLLCSLQGHKYLDTDVCIILFQGRVKVTWCLLQVCLSWFGFLASHILFYLDVDYTLPLPVFVFFLHFCLCTLVFHLFIGHCLSSSVFPCPPVFLICSPLVFNCYITLKFSWILVVAFLSLCC